jgi:beta-lactamase regulating signal transducer with metallopeptidase domain
MVYWMHTRLIVTCELSCDTIVMSTQKDRTVYARWLLDMRQKEARTLSVMMPMARQSSLGEGVSALLNDATKHRYYCCAHGAFFLSYCCYF